jgi:hypothetical protein
MLANRHYYPGIHPTMITGIAHVNIVVPSGTLDLAKEFYSGTLGFQSVSPPAIMVDVLAWSVNTCLETIC